MLVRRGWGVPSQARRSPRGVSTRSPQGVRPRLLRRERKGGHGARGARRPDGFQGGRTATPCPTHRPTFFSSHRSIARLRASALRLLGLLNKRKPDDSGGPGGGGGSAFAYLLLGRWRAGDPRTPLRPIPLVILFCPLGTRHDLPPRPGHQKTLGPTGMGSRETPRGLQSCPHNCLGSTGSHPFGRSGTSSDRE